jgi:hypothetical protein
MRKIIYSSQDNKIDRETGNTGGPVQGIKEVLLNNLYEDNTKAAGRY